MCHAQDIIVLPKEKKSQWMLILLSSDEKFCPWSLMIKECPFLSLSASLISQCILMFLCSSTQAEELQWDDLYVLRSTIHYILASHKTHESWEKQLSQLCGYTIEANRTTLWHARRKFTVMPSRIDLLSSPPRIYNIYALKKEDLQRYLRSVHPQWSLWPWRKKSLVTHFLLVTKYWEHGNLSTFS